MSASPSRDPYDPIVADFLSLADKFLEQGQIFIEIDPSEVLGPAGEIAMYLENPKYMFSLRQGSPQYLESLNSLKNYLGNPTYENLQEALANVNILEAYLTIG